jgi:hypothetical protein
MMGPWLLLGIPPRDVFGLPLKSGHRCGTVYELHVLPIAKGLIVNALIVHHT